MHGAWFGIQGPWKMAQSRKKAVAIVMAGVIWSTVFIETWSDVFRNLYEE